jgi:hypothetical protein
MPMAEKSRRRIIGMWIFINLVYFKNQISDI